MRRSRAEVTGEAIFHVVTEADFRARWSEGAYRPASLDDAGFVHCARRESLLAVADDRFSRVTGPVLLLEIDPAALAAKVRYEAPAPPGGGGSHLDTATTFPHVYGPIDAGAIVGVGVLTGTRRGFGWPAGMASLRSFLEAG